MRYRYMDQDRISGATEIEQRIIELLQTTNQKVLFETCKDLLVTYPSMGSLWRMANVALLEGNQAWTTIEHMQKTTSAIAKNGSAILEDGMTVVTYSRSSNVRDILVDNCRTVGHVICSESRPHYEGRKLAQELSQAGVPVTLTTDAGLMEEVVKADVVMVGADAYVNDFVVNKVGTWTIMHHAAESGLPVYVVAASYKAFPFVFIKSEDGKEVWDNSPSNMVVRNVYFGTANSREVSAFVTENGIEHKIPKFKGRLSAGITEIKEYLINQDGYLMIK